MRNTADWTRLLITAQCLSDFPSNIPMAQRLDDRGPAVARTFIGKAAYRYGRSVLYETRASVGCHGVSLFYLEGEISKQDQRGKTGQTAPSLPYTIRMRGRAR